MARSSLSTPRSAIAGRPRRSPRAQRGVPPEGVGAEALADAAEAAADPAACRAAAPALGGMQRWLERARALGLREPRELVFELHARQGLPLLSVAQALELGLDAVRALWQQGLAACAAQAPQSPADFIQLREHLRVVLWQTVEATHPDPTLTAEDADAEDSDPLATPSAPLLSIRLKALDQIAKLYDLALDQPTPDTTPQPYAAPEEIAAAVRERVLVLFGREG